MTMLTVHQTSKKIERSTSWIYTRMRDNKGLFRGHVKKVKNAKMLDETAIQLLQSMSDGTFEQTTEQSQQTTEQSESPEVDNHEALKRVQLLELELKLEKRAHEVTKMQLEKSEKREDRLYRQNENYQVLLKQAQDMIPQIEAPADVDPEASADFAQAESEPTEESPEDIGRDIIIDMGSSDSEEPDAPKKRGFWQIVFGK